MASRYFPVILLTSSCAYISVNFRRRVLTAVSSLVLRTSREPRALRLMHAAMPVLARAHRGSTGSDSWQAQTWALRLRLLAVSIAAHMRRVALAYARESSHAARMLRNIHGIRALAAHAPRCHPGGEVTLIRKQSFQSCHSLETNTSNAKHSARIKNQILHYYSTKYSKLLHAYF